MALVDDSEPMRSVLADSLLIIGGVLLVIGSFEPWTFGKVASDLITYRNGFQLDIDGGLSLAGVVPVAFGVHATLTGMLHLAQRERFRIFDRFPFVDGLVGVGIGLYGLGEARWYVRQMTSGYSSLFSAGTKDGIWLVLIGGVVLLMAAILETRYLHSETRRWLAGFVLATAVALSAFALAPK